MKAQNRKQHGTGKRLLCFLAVCCSSAALLFFIARMYRLEEVQVDGLSYYTKEEFLMKIASGNARKNTLLFRWENRRAGKPVIPYIESYDITVKDHNTIHIQVYEKILIGCVKIMGQYLYFDKDGLVTESAQTRLSGVPLIKGLEFDRIVLYEKLKIQKDELYDIILNLTKAVREYNIPADSIIFNSRGEVELEVGTLMVELGKRTVYDIPIQKLADMYPSISDRSLTIDLSGYDGGNEDIIAKPKED